MKKIISIMAVVITAMFMGCESGTTDSKSKSKSKVVDIKVLNQTKNESVHSSQSAVSRAEMETPNRVAADPSDSTTVPFADNKAECLSFGQLNFAAISKQTDGSVLVWHIAQDSSRYLDESTPITWESQNEFAIFNETKFYDANFSGGDAWFNYTTPTSATDVFNADYFLLTLPNIIEVYGTDTTGSGVFIGINSTAAEIGDSGFTKATANTKYADYKRIQEIAAEHTLVVFTPHVKYNCYFTADMVAYDDGTGGYDGRGQNKITIEYNGGNTAEDINTVITDLKLLSKIMYRIYVVAINPAVINADRSIPVSITACTETENGITINVNMSNIIKGYYNMPSDKYWHFYPENNQTSCNEPLGMSMTISDSILAQ